MQLIMILEKLERLVLNLEVRNECVFKMWLDNNVKSKVYNYEAYLEDLAYQYGCTGGSSYELSKNESRSGRTEIFSYTVETRKVDDEYITVFIF